MKASRRVTSISDGDRFDPVLTRPISAPKWPCRRPDGFRAMVRHGQVYASLRMLLHPTLPCTCPLRQAPKVEAPKADVVKAAKPEPKVDVPKPEAEPKADADPFAMFKKAPQAEAPKPEVKAPEVPKPEPEPKADADPFAMFKKAPQAEAPKAPEVQVRDGSGRSASIACH